MPTHTSSIITMKIPNTKTEEQQTLAQLVTEAEEIQEKGLLSRMRRNRKKKYSNSKSDANISSNNSVSSSTSSVSASISTPTSSPRRFRRKKKNATTPSPKKQDGNSKRFIFGRRIVKATHPPPLEELTNTTALTTSTSSKDDEDDSSHHNNRDKVSLSPIPSIQDETLREKTLQYRKERLEKSAAVRKGKKEELIDHRRKHEHDPAEVERKEKMMQRNELDKDKDVNPPSTILADLISVEPKFPEHKRKHEDDQEEIDEVGEGKKIRMSMDEDDNAHVEAEAKESSEKKGKIVKASGVRLLQTLPIVAAVIAVAAVCTMGYKRR